MSLRFLLDENQRGVLWQVIQRHNARGIDLLDAVRVGDLPDLPLGIDDTAILRWAEHDNRILVTFDKNTMPAHLTKHLSDGGHVPGVFMVTRDGRPLEVLEFLVLAAYASEAAEWQDSVRYIP